MLFLGRIILVLALLAAGAYGALHAVATLVTPEQRDIVIVIPMPKPGP